MARGEFIANNKFELACLRDALEKHRYPDPLGLRTNMLDRVKRAQHEEGEIDRERQAQGHRAAND